MQIREASCFARDFHTNWQRIQSRFYQKCPAKIRKAENEKDWLELEEGTRRW
jgi:hypothetical protein